MRDVLVSEVVLSLDAAAEIRGGEVRQPRLDRSQMPSDSGFGFAAYSRQKSRTPVGMIGDRVTRSRLSVRQRSARNFFVEASK